MILYGASGHGRVIKEIIDAQGGQIEAFMDDNLSLNEYCGKKVLHNAEGVDNVIVSIGDNAVRKKVVQKLNCHFGVAIHPTAVVSPSARIGEGTVVMAGAVINAGAVIGRHCIINTGASVDHECVLDDFVHIAPRAALCGQVHVGEGTLMGVCSCAIPCMKIGSWCTVGAGAAVVRDVAEGVTVVGNPARIIYSKDMNCSHLMGGVKP